MKRCFLLVFAISLVVRLVLYLAPSRSTEEITHCIDCSDYVQIAGNVVSHGTFSRSEQPPYEAQADRTALYPLLIAGAFKIAPSREAALTWVVVVQLIAGSLTASLFASIAHHVTRNLRCAWLAGILVGIEPYGIRYSMQAWTEPIFTFLLALSLLLLVKHLFSDRPFTPLLVASAIGCGLMALTRPVGHQIALVAVPASLLFLNRFPIRIRLLKGVIPFLFVYLLTISPWLVRNYASCGLLSISCGGTVAKFMAAAKITAALDSSPRVPTPGEMNRAENQLLAEWLPEFMETHGIGLDQKPEDWTYLEFPDEFTKPWMNFLSAKATPILLGNPGIYARNSLAMCLHMVFGFNKDTLCDILNIPSSRQRTSTALKSLFKGQIRSGLEQLGNIRLVDWVGLAWSGFYALIIPLFAAVGLGDLLKQRQFAVAAVFALGIILLVGLAGFAVSFSYQSSRYVMPAKPFLVILAVVGFHALTGCVRRGIPHRVQ